MQLLVTLGFTFWFGYHQPTRQFALDHPEVAVVAAILTLLIVIELSCNEESRRTAPHNYIALGLFTLAESYLMAMVTLRFGQDLVSD